jgi:uncharacterized RDD family membrane protein YckC
MSREGRYNGQTFGKQVTGCRVVRNDGTPFDFGSAALREIVIKGLLFGAVGGSFGGVALLLDWLWPLWDDENRALHDMIAGTHVIEA